MFQSKIFYRIFIPATLVIALLFSIMYLLVVPYIQKKVEIIEENAARTILNNVYAMVEQTHLELENYRQSITLERKEQLRNILYVADARIQNLLADVRSGKLTKEQARRTLLSELRHITYGRNDYIWASNYDSVLISHPDPKLNNADFSKVKDSRGNLIVPAMVEMARKGAGDGYYSYCWHRLGEEQPAEKITYFRNVPAFDIVIGTGVYLDDVETIMQSRKAIAVDNLRERLRQTRIAKTGYVYIFDGQYVMHIHPNANIEYTNVSLILDQTSKKPLFSMLMEIADKDQSLRYLWDKPSDPGQYVYEKISWVRYFREFDWYIGSSAYLDELGESARTLRNRVLAIFVSTLFLSVMLIYMFVNKLTSPLLQMRDTAVRVVNGDLDARCMVKRDDEIGVVAAAFDNMMERLQENIQNLDSKVADRTAALEKACIELKEMDQIKSDILTTVSHELRTPMTSVIGFAKQVKKKLEVSVFPKVVKDEKTDRAISQIRDNLTIIVTESERFSRLVNDVLYCSTLEAGRINWKLSAMAPDQLIKRVVAAFLELAELKGLKIYDEIESGLPVIMADESRIFDVLRNVVSNAIKFTEQGRIDVRVEKQGQYILFSVRDTGRGIALKDRNGLFETFRQIGDTLTCKPEGAGLGLSICQQIITHHGGEIWFESNNDMGSTFYFTLPISRSLLSNMEVNSEC